MRTILLLSGMVVLATFWTAASHAQNGSTEWRRQYCLVLHGGLAVPAGELSSGNHEEVPTGLGVGASLGYSLSPKMTVSLEADYHRFGDTARILPVTIRGDARLGSGSDPVLGVGIGMGLYHVEQDFFGGTSSQNTFGVNVGAGTSSHIGANTTFGVSLRGHYSWGRPALLAAPDYFRDTDAPFVTLQADLGLLL